MNKVKITSAFVAIRAYLEIRQQFHKNKNSWDVYGIPFAQQTHQLHDTQPHMRIRIHVPDMCTHQTTKIWALHRIYLSGKQQSPKQANLITTMNYWVERPLNWCHQSRDYHILFIYCSSCAESRVYGHINECVWEQYAAAGTYLCIHWHSGIAANRCINESLCHDIYISNISLHIAIISYEFQFSICILLYCFNSMHMQYMPECALNVQILMQCKRVIFSNAFV